VLRKLAYFIARRRILVLLSTFAFVGVAGAVGGPLATILTAGSNSFEDPRSESVTARETLAAATGGNPEFTVTAIVEGDPRSAEGRRRLDEVVRSLKDDPAVVEVFSYSSTRDPVFVSKDGSKTYLVASLRLLTSKQERDVAKRLLERFEDQPNVKLGGRLIANHQAGEVVREDLARAELIAFPLILLVALFVFRGVIAALMPLFAGGILIMGTFLALRIVNTQVELSIYALNLVTGLGLGLAIDYTLFIVSRYREELARVGPGPEALARTLTTAGRTVIFSTLTVAAALASLLVFPQPFLYSMAWGGIFVALMAAATALIALPALLALLGPRVNALSPKRWRQALEHPDERAGFWYRLSHAVMRRRVLVAAATAVLLLTIGLPVLNISFTGVEPSVLPTSQTGRQVHDTLATEFPPNRTTPVIVSLSGESATPSAVEAYVARVRGLAHVSSIDEPRRAAEDTWRIDVIPAGGSLDDGSQALVDEIRGLGTDFRVLVGGQTAAFVDQGHSIGSRLPLALLLLCLTTVLILFAMTGSVILPLKALVMNAITLVSTFGILVFVFQDGRLEGLLDYTGQGALEMTQPVLMAATAFGLSTDYGVFLLTRIKEARESGHSDDEAVAIGLERTGRIVTAAALLFCIAVGAFATSGIVFVKMLGIGMALAVIIDATLVRALLVPSLMAILGSRNWWAPAPLRRLHDRLGLSEGESPPVPAARS
jgi:RND superfamily putative drug exporter